MIERRSHESTMSKRRLTIEILTTEAKAFAAVESAHAEPILFGVTDGKAVGTYVELKFRKYLADHYEFEQGSAAKGIDFPALNVDLKVTSVKQPQSSCPYKSARQKIFGLGYSLLVFVYEKTDDGVARTGRLNFLHVIFVQEHRTGDYQMTRGLREILEKDGNAEDLIAYMADKNLPVDDVESMQIADDLLKRIPEQGYLTISNALQWRLQYSRAIEQAGRVDGLLRIQ
jgi:hypothetical protein